jgi:hypothetical protein
MLGKITQLCSCDLPRMVSSSAGVWSGHRLWNHLNPPSPDYIETNVIKD